MGNPKRGKRRRNKRAEKTVKQPALSRMEGGPGGNLDCQSFFLNWVGR